jgi:hypothetical protein
LDITILLTITVWKYKCELGKHRYVAVKFRSIQNECEICELIEFVGNNVYESISD